MLLGNRDSIFHNAAHRDWEVGKRMMRRKEKDHQSQRSSDFLCRVLARQRRKQSTIPYKDGCPIMELVTSKEGCLWCGKDGFYPLRFDCLLFLEQIADYF